MRLGTRLLFRENFHLHTTIFLYRGNVTFRQRHLRCGLELAFRSAKTFIVAPRFSYTVEKLHCGADRVVAPSGSRQYLSVCRRDFPMQADVAPKVWVESKTFMHKTIEGVRCLHTLGRTSILFAIKVLEFLKPFSKGFKWVWAKPTTLTPRPYLHLIAHFLRRACFRPALFCR